MEPDTTLDIDLSDEDRDKKSQVLTKMEQADMSIDPPPRRVRTPPPPSHLDGLSGVETPLRREVAGLSPTLRAAREDLLIKVPMFFRQRESNQASNNEAMQDMQGIQDADVARRLDEAEKKAEAAKKKGSQVKKNAGPGAKRKRRGQGGKTKAKCRKRGAVDESDEENAKESDEEESVEEEEASVVSEREKHPRRAAAAGKKERGPEWAMNAREALSAEGDGDAWKEMMGRWWKKEASRAFQGPRLEWRYINKAGEAQGVVDDEEGWGHLDTTGPNGMLNVLISLRWWKDTLGEETAPMIRRTLYKLEIVHFRDPYKSVKAC
ncbi:hypothetical protein C8R43DRAFT_1142592 [Mycena crocata]|nr:hypothetical protein C8R43DRAFT_1142592 [Mycena crocata]